VEVMLGAMVICPIVVDVMGMTVGTVRVGVKLPHATGTPSRVV
jgi:hypothetical protein